MFSILLATIIFLRKVDDWLLLWLLLGNNGDLILMDSFYARTVNFYLSYSIGRGLTDDTVVV